jgi:putative transposase
LETRTAVMDYITHWSQKTGLSQLQLWKAMGLCQSKFYDWQQRKDTPTEHHAPVPRSHWATPQERAAIIEYATLWPLEGYRRLSFMMLDAEVACVSPSTVYRVLKEAGLMGRKSFKTSKKGTGFVQPLQPHQHWHIDVTHLNLGGTFYYMFSVLDGYSRALIHWEIDKAMKVKDIELALQRAKESHPQARPRIISDNGPQFIAKDFKEFIRLAGMTHVRTSPYYPQSNGKMERWFGTAKRECIRPACPANDAEAKRVVSGYVGHYNDVRLHSAIGYVTPRSRLEGRDAAIQEARQAKLASARAARKSSTTLLPPSTPQQPNQDLVYLAA